MPRPGDDADWLALPLELREQIGKSIGPGATRGGSVNDQERAPYPSAELERLIIDLERHKDFEGSMVLRRMAAEVARLREELNRHEARARAAGKAAFDEANRAAEQKYRRTRNALEQVQDDSNVGYLSVAAQHLVAAALSEAPATEGSADGRE